MEAVRARLSPYTFDFVYVSPLLRAYQSYLVASPKAFHVELDTRIIENEESRNRYRPIAGYMPTDRLSCRFGDGWFIPCAARAEMIAEDIAANGAEKILIFAHNDIIKYLIAAWLGIDGNELCRNLTLDNGSLTGLGLDKAGNRLVQYVNDSSHLPDELLTSYYFRPRLSGELAS